MLLFQGEEPECFKCAPWCPVSLESLRSDMLYQQYQLVLGILRQAIR
jgi:hypothetical protein